MDRIHYEPIGGAVLSEMEILEHRETPPEADYKTFRSFRGDQAASVPAEIFKLRYEVYCEERAFLPAEQYRDGLECDEYEACSTHFAAYAPDETVVGAVRLVQPQLPQPYPFQQHCGVYEDYQMPPREQSGEISRLVVRRSHRRRQADSFGLPVLAPSHSDTQERRLNAERRRTDAQMLLMGMYREMYQHSRRAGIRYWFAAMERALARSLKRTGFDLLAIGPVSDYYGEVTPYVIDLLESESQLTASNAEFAAWFQQPQLAYA